MCVCLCVCLWVYVCVCVCAFACVCVCLQQPPRAGLCVYVSSILEAYVGVCVRVDAQSRGAVVAVSSRCIAAA